MVCFKVSGKATDSEENNWYVQSKNAIVSELQRIGSSTPLLPNSGATIKFEPEQED
jgi:hypothetical protein